VPPTTNHRGLPDNKEKTMKAKDIVRRLKSYPQQGKIIEEGADTGITRRGRPTWGWGKTVTVTTHEITINGVVYSYEVKKPIKYSRSAGVFADEHVSGTTRRLDSLIKIY
jgi:hypothetical protein